MHVMPAQAPKPLFQRCSGHAARDMPDDMRAALEAHYAAPRVIPAGSRAIKPGQLTRAARFAVLARGHAV